LVAHSLFCVRRAAVSALCALRTLADRWCLARRALLSALLALVTDFLAAAHVVT
jgi:hypothetical protein